MKYCWKWNFFFFFWLRFWYLFLCILFKICATKSLLWTRYITNCQLTTLCWFAFSFLLARTLKAVPSGDHVATLCLLWCMWYDTGTEDLFIMVFVLCMNLRQTPRAAMMNLNRSDIKQRKNFNHTIAQYGSSTKVNKS